MRPIIWIVMVALGLATGGCEEKSHNAATTVGTVTLDTEPTTMSEQVTHTDAEWKKILTPEEYAVLREKGTEAPFRGKYDQFFQPGSYSCAACGLELFTSETKFDSGCGWPAFYAAKAGDRVKLVHDTTYGMDRVEVLCARCGSHLGHVFDDAPGTPTGQRFCINSVSIKFKPLASGAETKPAN